MIIGLNKTEFECEASELPHLYLKLFSVMEDREKLSALHTWFLHGNFVVSYNDDDSITFKKAP